MRLDAATRRNLELTETLRGEPAPTLFSLLDECACGMGSRLLRHWLHHPLRDRKALEARHEAVSALERRMRMKYIAVLRRFADVERITSRVALKNARPRELVRTARQPRAARRRCGVRFPIGSALLDELTRRPRHACGMPCSLLEKAIHPSPRRE